MNGKPLITVITACLNSEKTIRNTIEAVLSQDYDNYEYIIKDGGSKDRTLDIVNEYKEAFGDRLRIIQQKDRCMYEAMNQGITESRGDIIGIVNSDDFYSPDTLSLVADVYSRAETELLVVFGDMERVDDKGKLIYRYHFDKSLIDRRVCFGHPSMFASRKVYEKIGLYDTSYSLAADGDWQLRAMEDGEIEFAFCPHVFSHMREGGASDQRKYRWHWFRERSRMDIEHHNGSKAEIYAREFWKVLKADIKAVLPEKFMSRAYELRYK